MMKVFTPQNRQNILVIMGILFILNFDSYFIFKRFDITQDSRYTLSETTKKVLEKVDSPLIIDVFLEGNFPADFKKLQAETKQLLEEFGAVNSNISFQFINPLEKEEERVQTMKMFYERGLMPMNVSVEDKGKQTQEVVFPWAVANYGNKGAKVQLLKNMMGAETAQKIESSIQHLEYAFADAIQKVSTEKKRKIAVLKGNGELEDIFIADFLKTVKENYYIGPITLDSVATQAQKTLDALNNYDLAIIAKPTEKFTEEEKLVLDQFIMQGGKTLWCIDATTANMENLYNETGTLLASPLDLNLTDMFFKYGIRINSRLLKDEYASPLKLNTGKQGSESNTEIFPWKYAPYIYPSINHPIVKNVDGIKFDFCSPIEVLGKTKNSILLETSKLSKEIGLPATVSLESVTEQSRPQDYAKGGMFPVSVLLEGKFSSAYNNRILPFKVSDYKNASKNTQMVVISDGDIIKNQLEGKTPLELGFDKYTQNMFGNKEFMLNCVNYLLDDNGLINIRNKDVSIPLLNRDKVHNNYLFNQMLTVGLPIVILAIFGFVFTYLRKKKYSINEKNQ
jgi:gliding-associated putative ABC transporter substrate-binding component GldG